MEKDNYVYPGKRYSYGGTCTGSGQGLSIRDYFAGIALQGLIAKDGYRLGLDKDAYTIADAMICYREQELD